MAYLHETVEEYDLPSHIRFGQKVESSDRDSREALWTTKLSQTGTG